MSTSMVPLCSIVDRLNALLSELGSKCDVLFQGEELVYGRDCIRLAVIDEYELPARSTDMQKKNGCH